MANNILLCSDIHLHSHKKSADRLQDGIEVLRWIFDTAIQHKVENVLFLGDLFHDRTKIEVLTLFRIFELFDEYFSSEKPPFQLHLLLGNHDMWHRDKWDVHSPIVLNAFNGVHIIDKPCSKKIQDHYIDFLPFTENPINDLHHLKSLVPKGEKRILCSHLAIHGAKLNSFTEADVVVEHDGEMMKVDQESLTGWSQIYLGHYHGEQCLGDNQEIEYVGSPYELTKSESGQRKHIILHDLDTFHKKYIINNFSPKHLILKPDELDKQDLSKHFVTVVVPNISDASNTAEIRQNVLNNYKVGSLEIKQDRKKKDNSLDQRAVLDAKAILETQDKMVEEYVKQCDVSLKENLETDLLIKLGLDIIEESVQDDGLHPVVRRALEACKC